MSCFSFSIAEKTRFAVDQPAVMPPLPGISAGPRLSGISVPAPGMIRCAQVTALTGTTAYGSSPVALIVSSAFSVEATLTLGKPT